MGNLRRVKKSFLANCFSSLKRLNDQLKDHPLRDLKLMAIITKKKKKKRGLSLSRTNRSDCFYCGEIGSHLRYEVYLPQIEKVQKIPACYECATGRHLALVERVIKSRKLAKFILTDTERRRLDMQSKGMSFRQIARAEGQALGTIKSCLHYARKKGGVK